MKYRYFLIIITFLFISTVSVTNANAPKHRPAWWSTYSCSQCNFATGEHTSLVCIVKCDFGGEGDYVYHARELTKYCEGFAYTGLSVLPGYCSSNSVVGYGKKKSDTSKKKSVNNKVDVHKKEKIDIIAFAKSLTRSAGTRTTVAIESIQKRVLNGFGNKKSLPTKTSSIFGGNLTRDLFLDEVRDVKSVAGYNNTKIGFDNTQNKCANFKRSFSIGSNDNEIKKIQKFLNGIDGIELNNFGRPGSVGHETKYFGQVTYNAIKKFQSMYKDEILKPFGIIAPTGYWGKSTRAQANKILGCN